MTIKKKWNKILWWNCGDSQKFKIEYIKYTINNLKRTILFISEAEITINDDVGPLMIKNYDLIVSNTVEMGKARSAAYVKSDVKYKRLSRVEEDNAKIISLLVDKKVYTGIYRPFKPTVDKSPVANFDKLLNSLRKLKINCDRLYI